MQKTLHKLHVVSHTHWDREWYSTFQQFRQRLILLVDRLLDLMERNPDFRYFVLDGQAILVEDYLEIRPENRERLKALVQNGRIEIGPWYVLPDEFLVSGEALIRNLQIGHRVAGENGGVMKVGYLPDSFGHIAQMPQILRGFNIDNFIFTRGLGDEQDRLGTEFLWIAPDGNRVLTICQLNGYCNGNDLGYEGLGDRTGEAPQLDTFIDRLYQEIEQIGRLSKPASDGAKHILINNGCDHQEPQAELPRLLSHASAVLKDCVTEHTSFSRFLYTLRRAGLSLSNYTGEMHGGKLHFILSGVLSSRVYLKQRNAACEMLLARVAEPLAALAWLRAESNHWSGLLSHAWKTLLKNHPHDSICGCSIDLVHREMLTRFDEANHIGENVVDATLEALAQRVRRNSMAANQPAVIVANPLAVSRSEVVRCLVCLPPKTKLKALTVVDSNDQPLPTQVLKVWPAHPRNGYSLPEAFGRLGQTSGRYPLAFETKREQWLNDRANYQLAPRKKEIPWYVAEIEFLTPEMGPVSYRTFSVRAAVPAQAASATASRLAGVKIKRNVVENPFLRVKFYPDGSFDLFDKVGKRQFKRCHIFEDAEDVGDEYDYAPAKRSQIVFSRGKKGKLRLVHKSPVAAEFEASLSLSLPAAFDRDRGRRSTQIVRCPLTVRFTITATAPYLAVRTTFQNSALDHRLRVQFSSPIKSTTSLAGQQFFTIERPLKKTPGKNWRQPPSPTEPMQHFCALADRKGGLAILVQGLYEYEARREGKGTALLLTLLRSVGWLSRDDLATRPGHAGPALPTPEAQCLDTQEFHYAIMPYTGNWQKANLPLAAQRFRVPLLDKPCLGPGGTLPADFSLFHIEPKSIVVTAIKKSDQRDTVIVRLYNASALRFKGKLFWGLPIARAWKLNLLEERLEEATVFSNSRIDVDFPAWRIVTLELEMSKSVLGM